MKPSPLHHDHPSKMEARRIEEIRKMTPQQRFDHFIAIIELSYLLKNGKKSNKVNG